MEDNNRDFGEEGCSEDNGARPEYAGESTELSADLARPGPPPEETGVEEAALRRYAEPQSISNHNPYNRADAPHHRKKERSAATKAGMIIACVLTLIVLTAIVFMDSGGNSPSISIPQYPNNYGNDPAGGNGDFNKYLDDYFDSGATGMPRTGAAAGISMEISPLPDGECLVLQEIYQKCSPSIVAITASVGDMGYKWGTGIIMTEDGFIVTNAHLLEGADSALILLEDDSEFEAMLVGFDLQSDLAVLKIEASGLCFAEFGESDLLQVGEDVVAIGNPLGEKFRGTMTNGIISAINRNIPYKGGMMTLLQTNAAINDGNSGGPLLNMYGQVVGITNMKMLSYYSSIEGIGFAIPTAIMKDVVNDLLEKSFSPGKTAIGVTIGAVPEEAAARFSLPDGLFVSSVVTVSDAYEKGIRAGDIITAIDGESVSTLDEVNAIKDSLAVGDTIVLTVFRNDGYFDVTVRLMDYGELYDVN